MTVQERLERDVTAALKSRDRERVGALRLFLAAVQQEAKSGKGDLDDEGVTAILQREAKKRREALQQYTDAGRDDLANKEQHELTLLDEYLPEQLDDEAIHKHIQSVLEADRSLHDVSKVGQVMGQVMGQLKGKADGKRVQELVREALSVTNDG